MGKIETLGEFCHVLIVQQLRRADQVCLADNVQQAGRNPEEGVTVEENIGSSRISVVTGGRDLIASPVIFRRHVWRRYCVTEPILPLVSCHRVRTRSHRFTRHLSSSRTETILRCRSSTSTRLSSSRTDEISSLYPSSFIVGYGVDTTPSSQCFRSSYVVIAESPCGYCTSHTSDATSTRRTVAPIRRLEKSTSAVHTSTSLRTASRVNVTSPLCHLSSTLRAVGVLSLSR